MLGGNRLLRLKTTTAAPTPAASTLWTPANLTVAAHAWYDAQTINQFTLDANGVTQWLDRSGNGRHLAPLAAAASRPTYNTGENGAGGGVVYGDVDDVLRTSNFGLNSGTKLSGFVVLKKNANTDTGDRVLSFKTAAAADDTALTSSLAIQFTQAGATEVQAFGGGAARATAAGWTNDVTSIFSFVFDGTNATTWRNGMQGTAPAAYVPDFTNVSEFAVGASAVATPTAFLGGSIAEIIIIGNSLTRFERERIEGYLAWKWGLVAGLNTDHHFKNAPPIAGNIIYHPSSFHYTDNGWYGGGQGGTITDFNAGMASLPASTGAGNRPRIEQTYPAGSIVYNNLPAGTYTFSSRLTGTGQARVHIMEDNGTTYPQTPGNTVTLGTTPVESTVTVTVPATGALYLSIDNPSTTTAATITSHRSSLTYVAAPVAPSFTMAVTETGPDTTAAALTTGAVSATLTVTETGTDTTAIALSAIDALALAVTETGPDTTAIALSPKAGFTLTVTEQGSDTFASTLNAKDAFTLAVTEQGSDTFAGNATNPIGLTFAVTETGPDVYHTNLTSPINATLAVTEDTGDTVAIAVTVSDPVIPGTSLTLAVTETGPDTTAVSVSATISGSLAVTETGSDTFAGNIAPTVSFAMAAPEGGQDTTAIFLASTAGMALAVTETGSDGLSGAVSPTAGFAMAVTETGQDSTAVALSPAAALALAVTETGQDTFEGTVEAAQVAGPVSFNMAVQEDTHDTPSIALSVPTAFTMSFTEEGQDTFAATGDATQPLPGIFFDMAVTEETRDRVQIEMHSAAPIVITPPSRDREGRRWGFIQTAWPSSFKADIQEAHGQDTARIEIDVRWPALPEAPYYPVVPPYVPPEATMFNMRADEYGKDGVSVRFTSQGKSLMSVTETGGDAVAMDVVNASGLLGSITETGQDSMQAEVSLSWDTETRILTAMMAKIANVTNRRRT